MWLREQDFQETRLIAFAEHSELTDISGLLTQGLRQPRGEIVNRNTRDQYFTRNTDVAKKALLEPANVIVPISSRFHESDNARS